MRRRQLLRAGAGSLLASGLTLNAVRTWAASAGSAVDSRLLVVFLRGAYDACNVLVPQTSFYAESRPNIGIARPGTGPDAALDYQQRLGPEQRIVAELDTEREHGEVASALTSA